jgi:hypothetical protein
MENDQQQEQDQSVAANKQNNLSDSPLQNVDDMNANISAEEMAVLENLETDPESEDAVRVSLENTDNDGELLNEQSGSNSESGEDLDVPGAELDDENEEIGEEDEENNSYSQADTD